MQKLLQNLWTVYNMIIPYIYLCDMNLSESITCSQHSKLNSVQSHSPKMKSYDCSLEKQRPACSVNGQVYLINIIKFIAVLQRQPYRLEAYNSSNK